MNKVLFGRIYIRLGKYFCIRRVGGFGIFIQRVEGRWQPEKSIKIFGYVFALLGGPDK